MGLTHSFNRMREFVCALTSAGDLLQFGYTRNLNGLIARVVETESAGSSVARRDYTYDALRRLTRAERWSDTAGTRLRPASP